MDDSEFREPQNPKQSAVELEYLRKNNLISPFVPGTVVAGPSLVIDKNGCAWWVRPVEMLILRARPHQAAATDVEDVDLG